MQNKPEGDCIYSFSSVREMHQDSYTSDEEGTVVAHAADELELIAVSKRPTKLLPHATFVHTNLEPLEQEATPLKSYEVLKRWTISMLPSLNVT